MAVALITTLYGAVVSNLFCLPFADKLALFEERLEAGDHVVSSARLLQRSGVAFESAPPIVEVGPQHVSGSHVERCRRGRFTGAVTEALENRHELGGRLGGRQTCGETRERGGLVGDLFEDPLVSLDRALDVVQASFPQLREGDPEVLPDHADVLSAL